MKQNHSTHAVTLPHTTLYKAISLLSTLIVSLTLSACEDPPSQTKDTPNQQPSAMVDKPVPAKPTPPPKTANTDTTLASITLTMVLDSVKLPIQTNDSIEDSVKNCINDISEDFALQDVQAFLNNKFSTTELDEINAFYKTEEAIAYSKYGRDQILIASGVVPDKASKPLKRKQLEKINAFIDSDLGKKYIQVSESKAEDSLTSIIIPLLAEEFKKCGAPSLEF